MKAAAISFESNFVSNPAGRFGSLCAVTVGSMRGWCYWRAAEKDEKDGFPFTAAWEWQRAAECFAWISLISDRCWQEWERIMHLPRLLSKPIGEAEVVVVQHAPAAVTQAADLIPVAA